MARGEDDTELTFHIINNTDIDYDVYGMCFYSNGEYVDEDGCEVPAGGNVTYA